jgi:hypothetical protein
MKTNQDTMNEKIMTQKLTNVQREELKQIVTDCIIRRLTTKEMQHEGLLKEVYQIFFLYLVHQAISKQV